MSVLDNADKRTTTTTTAGAGSQGGLLGNVSIPESSPIDTSFSGMPSASSNAAAAEPSSSTTAAPPPAQITRLDSVAIGPSTDEAPVVDASGPVLVITLLLPTGARHPYKIDERYLTKRNVNVPGVTEAGRKDPYSISVYTLKELILREWREEWEAQPSSPSSIRLIYFGRLLDDKTPLKGMLYPPYFPLHWNSTDTANIC